jgi:hypothetical protein
MFSGCDRTESDWEQAKGANTIPAYKEFLSKHSEGPRADQAKAAIQAETDWDQANATNTIQSYKEFLSKHSQGPHTEQAKAAIQTETDWEQTERSNTVPAYTDFLAKHPGAHTEQANAAIQTETDWKQVSDHGSVEGYDGFLKAHGNSAHVAEAVASLTALRDDRDWATAKSAGTVAACENYLKAHPNGKYVNACSELKNFAQDDPPAVIDSGISSLRMYKDSNGNVRQSGAMTFSIGFGSGGSGTGASDYSNKRVINDTGGPIGLISITRGQQEVATLFLTGKESVFGPESRLVKGAGYIQATPGEHVNIVVGDRDGQIQLSVTRIDWDETGATTHVEGLDPVIKQSDGSEIQINPAAVAPPVQNGVLTVSVNGGVEFKLKMKFGYGAKLLRVSQPPKL